MTSKFDAEFKAIFDRCDAEGLGGDIKFVECFASFLRRKTSLLASTQSTKEVTIIVQKHAKHLRKQREKAKKQATSQPAKASAQPKAAPAASTPLPASKVEEITEEEFNAAKAGGPNQTEVKEEEVKKGPAPVGNGGTTDKYTWTQTLKEVTVSYAVPEGTRGRSVAVEFTPNTLKAGLVGQEPFTEGKLHGPIHVDNSTWSLDPESNLLTIEMSKVEQMAWWKGVIEGDPTINTQDIVPENSKLDDLDRDTRATVEKMMFDQRQKQMGKPTSDEMEKQAAIQKFMAMHPEMDFSQAKIS
jgi:hypothetical protein